MKIDGPFYYAMMESADEGLQSRLNALSKEGKRENFENILTNSLLNLLCQR